MRYTVSWPHPALLEELDAIIRNLCIDSGSACVSSYFWTKLVPADVCRCCSVILGSPPFMFGVSWSLCSRGEPCLRDHAAFGCVLIHVLCHRTSFSLSSWHSSRAQWDEPSVVRKRGAGWISATSPPLLCCLFKRILCLSLGPNSEMF